MLNEVMGIPGQKLCIRDGLDLIFTLIRIRLFFAIEVAEDPAGSWLLIHGTGSLGQLHMSKIDSFLLLSYCTTCDVACLSGSQKRHFTCNCLTRTSQLDDGMIGRL